MKKFLYAALMFFALGFFSRGAASADEALMESMAPGTWTANPRYITFGEYNGHTLRWRVLEVRGDKTAFLVLDDVLRYSVSDGGDAMAMPFDYGADATTFPSSTIKSWLNHTFLDTAFTANEQNAILETNYGPDNARLADQYKWTEGKSKVFLLSVGEAGNSDYFKDDAGRAVEVESTAQNYWLRSPGNDDYLAAIVLSDGLVNNVGYYVFHAYAIRPALKINLLSPVFTPAATVSK